MIMVLEAGGRNARAYLPRHITRALIHTNCLLVDKSQEQCSSPPTNSRSCVTAFSNPPRDLALIHSHCSDVLTPKGPCPAVTEQCNLSYCAACSAEKNIYI